MGVTTDDVSGPARHAAPDSDASTVDDEGMPQPIAELAASAVRFVASRYGVLLDFSPDTLSFVDQYIRDARKDAATLIESIPLLQAFLGAYLGEVVRREFGGYWYVSEEHEGYRLDLAPVYLSFNPIGLVRESLLLETAPGWHAHFEIDPADREAIRDRLAALPEVDPEDYYLPTTRYDTLCIVVDALRVRMDQRGLAGHCLTTKDYPR